MIHRLSLVPIVLLASSLPALAAPFCHMGPRGFEFSNQSAAWKLQVRSQGDAILGWTRGERNFIVRFDSPADKTKAEVILDLPGKRYRLVLDPEEAGTGPDGKLAVMVGLFAAEGPGATQEDTFMTFMQPFRQAMNVEVQAQAGTDSGDPARNQALHDYLETKTTHGVGSLAALKKLVHDYRAAMKPSERKAAEENQAFFGCDGAPNLSHDRLRVSHLLPPVYVFDGIPPRTGAVHPPAPQASAEPGSLPAFTPAAPARARSASPVRKSRENPASSARRLVTPGAKSRPEPSLTGRAFGTPLNPSSQPRGEAPGPDA